MGGGEVGGMDQKKSVFVKNKIENLFFGGRKRKFFLVYFFWVNILVLWVDIFGKF